VTARRFPYDFGVIGRTLKNYTVEEQLGKGGMGVVYRARDLKLDRSVALKVLPPELVRDEARRQRFVREARAASAVNHPAIAQIYEIDELDDLVFIVMEYVDGSTVRQLVARGELDVASALEVGIQVADALARAHAAGIVHRDIKSDNIMVTKDGHPKVLDFGLAKLVDLTEGDPEATRAETLAMTQAGVVLGTVAYMSPEQARGLPADKRSDVFSFGVVLYEMATGKLPFQGASALDTMHAIAFDATQPIHSIRADLPYSLQRSVDRCLQKKPEDRYQDMGELVGDLKHVRRELESGASSRQPLTERAQAWTLSLGRGGSLWIGVAGFALGGLFVAGIASDRVNMGPFFALLFGGVIFWRRFRTRRHRSAAGFARAASKLREVRLVSQRGNELVVVVDRPTAKTYVKLNALLSRANGHLLHGAPFTLAVRESVSEEERRTLLTSVGLQYARDDA
jgi:tRNA A-37 threonylcarbamoyl transferase component Bud32/membrane protein implicated in regulation of membrane protease activity